MSTATIAKPQAKQPGKRRRMSLPVLLLIIAGVLVLTSIVRLISGADGITSTGQMSAIGKASSAHLISCRQATAGRRSSSHSISRGSRALVPLMLKDAIRIPGF